MLLSPQAMPQAQASGSAATEHLNQTKQYTTEELGALCQTR